MLLPLYFTIVCFFWEDPWCAVIHIWLAFSWTQYLIQYSPLVLWFFCMSPFTLNPYNLIAPHPDHRIQQCSCFGRRSWAGGPDWGFVPDSVPGTILVLSFWLWLQWQHMLAAWKIICMSTTHCKSKHKPCQDCSMLWVWRISYYVVIFWLCSRPVINERIFEEWGLLWEFKRNHACTQLLSYSPEFAVH